MSNADLYILNYLLKHSFVDILDTDFVRGYSEATNSPVVEVMYGAPKCPRLSRNLAKLYKAGFLTRRSVGVPYGGGEFPKWVYSYTLSESTKASLSTPRSQLARLLAAKYPNG